MATRYLFIFQPIHSFETQKCAVKHQRPTEFLLRCEIVLVSGTGALEFSPPQKYQPKKDFQYRLHFIEIQKKSSQSAA